MAGLPSVVAVAAGQAVGYALTADGTVWATGDNSEGQLGDGTTSSSRAFHPVPQLGKAVAIAAAPFTAYALLADGTVWSWGRNTQDELGDGLEGGFSAHPVQVVQLPAKVVAIGTTFASAYVLLDDGSVRTWGAGPAGLLGTGGTTNSPVPVTPTGLTGVRALATNQGEDAYVLKNDGTVWAWGPNGDGSIGDGTSHNRLAPVEVTGATGAVCRSGCRRAPTQ